LPHSDIPGSKLVCSSPRLFAAYCVLHRLLAPRHSPYALSSLTIGSTVDFRPEIDNGPRPSSTTRSQIRNVFPPSLETLRVFCGSEKLPFAGYSVVKDHPGEITPRGNSRKPRARSPDRLARSVAGPQAPRRSLASSPATCRTPKVSLGRLASEERTHARSKLIACSSRRFPQNGRSTLAGLPSRSCSRSERRAKAGGEYRSRTGDLLVANQALSQLS
jgi:hypothetical protein